jgi:conjugative relaxase-like TrwC/TraI family protein
MLRINQNTSAAGAKSYYSRADYYTEGQELESVWRGKGAARLGLSGAIAKSDWDALCDNRNPTTGKTLTSRQKSERRVGWDFNFHVPKSVSSLVVMEDASAITSLPDDPRALKQIIFNLSRERDENARQRDVRTRERDDWHVKFLRVETELLQSRSARRSRMTGSCACAVCFLMASYWDVGCRG